MEYNVITSFQWMILHLMASETSILFQNNIHIKKHIGCELQLANYTCFVVISLNMLTVGLGVLVQWSLCLEGWAGARGSLYGQVPWLESGAGAGLGVPCTVRSHVQGRGPCMVSSNVSWVMVTWDLPPPWTNRQYRKYYPPATSLADGKNLV